MRPDVPFITVKYEPWGHSLIKNVQNATEMEKLLIITGSFVRSKHRHDEPVDQDKRLFSIAMFLFVSTVHTALLAPAWSTHRVCNTIEEPYQALYHTTNLSGRISVDVAPLLRQPPQIQADDSFVAPIDIPRDC